MLTEIYITYLPYNIVLFYFCMICSELSVRERIAKLLECKLFLSLCFILASKLYKKISMIIKYKKTVVIECKQKKIDRSTIDAGYNCDKLYLFVMRLSLESYLSCLILMRSCLIFSTSEALRIHVANESPLRHDHTRQCRPSSD